jgi:hypothetical protein
MEQDYNYYDYENSLNDNRQYDRFHFFDYVLLAIACIALVTAIVYGVIEQNQVNEITKKTNDITEITKALDLYYNDSNKVPSERKYPVAVCNGKPNEIDFEYTLRNALAGKNQSLSTFGYIDNKNFPFDTSGEYASRIVDKKVKLRDCTKIFGNKKPVDYIYSDQSNSCNFDKENVNNKYQSCYLYSTDNLGFEYKVGYFDQYKNSYTIYSKIRDQPIQISKSGG